MSRESAAAFIERLKTDETFRNKYISHDEKPRFLKKLGYDFTDTEIDEIKDQLNDDELIQISGGGCYEHCGSLQTCGIAGNCTSHIDYNY